MPPDGDWMAQMPDVALPGQSPPQASTPSGFHPAPDGSGVHTDLSDDDYTKFMGGPPAEAGDLKHFIFPDQHTGALPPVNLPRINLGTDPTKASGSGGGTGILALPAPGSPAQPTTIDVSGARPETGTEPPKSDKSWMDALPTVALPGDEKKPAVPQMEGIARELALPASNLAKGVVGVTGMPGDIARGVTWLGGKQAASSLQGNPLAPISTFFPENPKDPLPIATPGMLAASPGKIDVTPPTGHNPIDSETLLGLTKSLGLTDRPDLEPQNLREKLEAGAAQGVGMMAPALLTGGGSTVPAALRLMRSGAAMGVGSEAGGEFGQAVAGTPGHVVGGLVGGVVPALTGHGIMAASTPLKPLLQKALPVTQTARDAVAARSFAEANTPDVRAALANPETLVPGSPATSYQVTGNPVLGAHERGMANQRQYKPAFDAVRQEQNRKQVAAMQGADPGADVSSVQPWFQGRLDQMRAAEEAETKIERAATQQAVEATGNVTTPHGAGATVRGAVEGQRAPALSAVERLIAHQEGEATGATERLGGEGGPGFTQAEGGRMRGAWPTEEAPGSGVLGHRAEAKAAADRLYAAVDPKKDLVVGGLDPVGDTAAILRGDVEPRKGWSVPEDRAEQLSEFAAAGKGDLAGPEGKVLEFAASLRNNDTFQNLRKLQRMIGQAQREIARNLGRESLPYRRMTELRNATEEALSRAAGEAAGKDPIVREQLSLLAGEELPGGLEAGRRLPLPPQTGPDLLGHATPESTPRPTAEPTIQNDQRQQTMPGMEPSAVQAQAARDQQGRGGLAPSTPRVPANEGLFARPETPQPALPMEPRVSRFPNASDPNFRHQITEAPAASHASAADWVFAQGRETGYEHLALVDNRTGEVIHAGTNGLPGEVHFRGDTGANETDAYTIHHNHPNSTAISREDVSMLANPGISHVVAHGHDGSTTVAKLSPKFAAERSPEAISQNANALKYVYQRALEHSATILRPLLNEGKIARADATSLYNDIANRLLHAQGVLDYASTKDLLASVKAAFNETLQRLGHDPATYDRYSVAIRPEERVAGLPAPARGDPERSPGEGGVGGSAPISDAGRQSNAISPATPENPAGDTGPRAGERLPDEDTIYTPTGRHVGVRYRVVDASKLTASHTDDLRPNPAYPAELQPRERERGASQAQVQQIAGNLQPERLGPSQSAMEGAPVVGPDGIVESGNGRVLGIRRAYAEGNADAYRDYLTSQGYDTTGIKEPVLVRERTTEMTPEERKRFTEEANTSPGLAMGAAEKARVDAGRMSDDLMGLWRSGDIRSAANRDFVRDFMNNVPDANERGTLQTADGALSRDGAQRIQAALLHKAYGDARFVSAISEAQDETIKAFGSAMTDVAGDVARLKADIVAGTADPATDISTNLIDAARLVSQARQKGISIKGAVGQSDMLGGIDPLTEQILRVAYGDNLTGRVNSTKFADKLTFYVDEARKQGGLFGTGATPEEILDQGVRRAGSEPSPRAKAAQTSSSGSPGYGAGADQSGREARGFGDGTPGQGVAVAGGVPAEKSQVVYVQPGMPGATQLSIPGTARTTPVTGMPYARQPSLPEPTPNVVNISPGMPGAAQRGFPGSTPELTPNFNPEAQAALRRANANYADYKAKFGRGAVGDIQAPGNTTSGYRVPDSAVPSALWQKGEKGAEAADSLIAATGSREAALKILGEYPAYSLRQAAGEMGTLSVPKYEKWAKDHAAILDKFPELKASFDTAAKARAVLDDLRSERAALEAANPLKKIATDAEVMTHYVQPGPKGYEGAQSLLRDANGSPEALQATRDYLADVLRNGERGNPGAEIKSGLDAGTLDLGGYQKFMSRYDSFLSHPAMTEARAAFADAGRAQETLDAAATAHRDAQKAYQISVARHFLNPDSDPVKSMGAILSRRDPGPELADLARVTSGDPTAKEAMQSTVINAILDRVTSNNPVGSDLSETFLKSDATQKMLGSLVGDDLKGPLRHVLTPDQLDALNKVRLDMRRANLSISGNKNPSGSDTGLITSAREADEHRPTVVGALTILETMGEAGKHLLGPFGRPAAMIVGALAQTARHIGYGKINDIRAEALLHPEKMSALLALLPTEAEVPSRVAAISRQLLARAALSGQRTTNDEPTPRSAAR